MLIYHADSAYDTSDWTCGAEPTAYHCLNKRRSLLSRHRANDPWRLCLVWRDGARSTSWITTEGDEHGYQC